VKTVGERIAYARQSCALTQAELGKLLGVTKQSVSQWERDTAHPRFQVFDRLAEIFSADPEWFERGRGKAPEMTYAKVYTVAHVPAPLQQAWLQHLRDFDVAHPGCHFEVAIDGPPDVTLGEMVEVLRVNPGFTFQHVFERKQP
jgi:transcriptional regulator with XRE-family HTH domain